MNADDPSLTSGANDPEDAETTQIGLPQPLLFHYTDGEGYKAIGSQVDWTFKASQPAGNREWGAYFTNLPPGTSNLPRRLRIPRAKTEFVFCFRDAHDLIPIRGDRGRVVVYSPDDYVVAKERQVAQGRREDW